MLQFIITLEPGLHFKLFSFHAKYSIPLLDSNYTKFKCPSLSSQLFLSRFYFLEVFVLVVVFVVVVVVVLVVDVLGGCVVLLRWFTLEVCLGGII